MNVGNCTLVLSLLSRLDEVYFDQYGSIMARFADIQSITEVILEGVVAGIGCVR